MRRLLIIIAALCLISGCSGSVNAVDVSEDADEVDIDFTELTSNLVYAEIYNIMQRPGDYMGQTFKLTGPYYADYYDVTGQTYHFVLIMDALACCQQGLEFRWNGSHRFPEDYPGEMEDIALTGTWDSYDEDGRTYYYLQVDDVETL
jgi:hypothetical protein